MQKGLSIVSVISLLVAVALGGALLFVPEWGLKLLWGALIPAAPLLLFLAPGLWRQICPMGSIAVLPRDLGLVPAAAVIPSARAARILRIAGLTALLGIPPLRPWFIDQNGPATFVALLVYSLIAYFLGAEFVGRGAFCNGACPVHFVEMIYGQFSKPLRLPVRCGSCDGCTPACVDVHEGWSLDRALSHGQHIYRLTAWGLPGFVIGWFQISKPLPEWPSVLLSIYGPTLGGFLGSLLLFSAADLALAHGSRKVLTRFAALLALGAYYWFTVPRLACLWTGSYCAG